MQQPSTIFYGLYNQDGGGAANPPQWLPDSTKHNQYQWENNGAFHVASGNSYGPGQVQGGGGQNRVQVNSLGPQQPQQPSQPTPTSTPPGIHGDMNKQQSLMQTQSAQMNYVQTRPINAANFATFSRGAIQQPQQIRTHPRTQVQINYGSIPMQGVNVLTPAPAQALVQTLPYPSAAIMYQQPRQGSPYNNQGQYMPSIPYFNTHPNQAYFPSVIQQTFQGMSSGGPSPQAGGQQQPVQMMRQNMVSNVPVSQPVKQEHKKRPYALKIIDPSTNQEVALDNDNGGNNNNITPTRSNDSSARETPQPNAGVSVADNTVAAEFAAKVAACAASEPITSSLNAPDPVQDSIPVAISESDVHHKQQPIVVPSDKILNTVLSTSSEEFIPRSLQQAQLCEPPQVEEMRTTLVPTVSAETNSPAIDIQRPKEQFPALKNPTMSTGVVTQSPMKVNSKKQKANENERQQAASAPLAAQPLPLDIKDSVTNNKKGAKGTLKEENVAVPKERREKPRSVSKEQSPTPSPVITSVIASEIMSSQIELTPAPVKDIPSTSVGTYTKDTVKNNIVIVATVVPVEEPSVVPASKAPPHHNGETALPEVLTVSADGNKTARGQKKKSGKMRVDLNRKGVEKEGSEMDAFTTEPTIVSEDKERPATPISPPPVTISPVTTILMPPTPPPAAVEPAAPPSPVDKIKEDMEEKEDKLVAAKNEENTKVSAMIKAEEEPAPVIETPVPQLTLKRSYKKDQWSPLNQDGKKKYDRDFLMELKGEPQSNMKPENLPDVVAVLRDSSNNIRNQNTMPFMSSRGDSRVMLPDFLQKNTQSQRGPLPSKKGSQQGNKAKSKVFHMSLTHDDVKLKTVENAWKPTRLTTDAEKSRYDKETEELIKNVRGILNKLTPEKFDTLIKKFMQLPINSESRLKTVINLIFEKAVDEPSFSKAYANMCKICSKLEVSKVINGQEEKVNFRKLLITKCQTQFESNKPAELDSAKWLAEIRNCNDPEKKKELQLAYEEKERQIRMKSVGNIRFIGELFKLGMLTPTIMFRCLDHLLSNCDEESLECLCKLLTTIGKDLESTKNPSILTPYIQKMNAIVVKKEGSAQVSSRVRFMLLDVLDLQGRKWVPRREDNNPKTIDQINKEAERESMELTMALNQQPPRMNRHNDRQDERKRGNRGNNNQNEEGWVNVSGRFHHNKTFSSAFESSKMQNMLKPEADLNSVSLGKSSQFQFITPAKTMETKPGTSFTTSNVFSALSRGGDERNPPKPPTIDEQRFTRGDRMKSKFGAAQREEVLSSIRNQTETSQPPSRDSSVPRQPLIEGDNKEATEAAANAKREEEEEKSLRIANEKALQLAEMKLQRQTVTIFEEYLSGCSSLEDVKQDVEQFYTTANIGDFIRKALEISLEKKAGAQKSIGVLIASLMDYNMFSPDVLVDELGLIYENADDVAIDVPKVWELQAHVIVPILVAEKINFGHFKDACGSVLKTTAAPKLLVPALTLLDQEKGVGFVRKVWDSSNVSLTDFLPADVDVEAFMKENSLEYLTGEAPKYDSSNQLSMDQVQEKMLRLMQNNQPYEKILDFISSNVGDKVEDLQFIRALITAICEACIEGANHNLDININRFQQYEKLIQRYVDNKEDRELACLSSVHILLLRLEHPQGLTKNIFNLFFENSLISCESFLKWRALDQETLEQKGVSLYALASFFSALEDGQDVDTDDENS